MDELIELSLQRDDTSDGRLPQGHRHARVLVSEIVAIGQIEAAPYEHFSRRRDSLHSFPVLFRSSGEWVSVVMTTTEHGFQRDLERLCQLRQTLIDRINAGLAARRV